MTKKDCIINPATGRAVKTTTALGKKLIAQAQQLEEKAGKVLKATAKRAVTKKPELPKPEPKPEPKSEPKVETVNPSYTPEELNALQKEQIIDLIFRTYELREGRILNKDAQSVAFGKASKKQLIFSAVEIYVMRDPNIDAILKKKKKFIPLNDSQIQEQYEKSIKKYVSKNETAQEKTADIIFRQRVIQR